jgi:hypothetical protein
MTAKELPEGIKPSRLRKHEKPDRETRIKDRVPRHTPYKRKHDNLTTKTVRGEFNDDSE